MLSLKMYKQYTLAYLSFVFDVYIDIFAKVFQCFYVTFFSSIV